MGGNKIQRRPALADKLRGYGKRRREHKPDYSI